MKFTISANELVGAMTKVRAVLPSRTTMPILEMFLIEALPAELRVTTSHADLQASASIPCEVLATGAVAVSAQIFGVVKSLSKASIDFEAGEEGRAVVTGPRQRYEFATLPAVEFPVMAMPEGGAAFDLPIDALAAALDLTQGFASINPGEFNINGVCMRREGLRLAFAATDRNRFSRLALPMPDGAEGVQSHILPMKTVTAVLGCLPREKGGGARISVNDIAVSVEVGRAVVISKLIAGSFLKYDVMVAGLRDAANFRATRSEISEAVARIVALRPETKDPVIVIRSNATGLDLVSDRRGSNAGKEEIEAEVGEPIAFGVSSTYFSKMLLVWPESATLEFGQSRPGEPISIRSAQVPGLLQVVSTMSP